MNTLLPLAYQTHTIQKRLHYHTHKQKQGIASALTQSKSRYNADEIDAIIQDAACSETIGKSDRADLHKAILKKYIKEGSQS